MLTLFWIFEKQRREVYTWHRKFLIKKNFSLSFLYLFSCLFLYIYACMCHHQKHIYIYEAFSIFTSATNRFRFELISVCFSLFLDLSLEWSGWTTNIYAQFLIMPLSIHLNIIIMRKKRVPAYKQEQLSFFSSLSFQISMFITDNDIDTDQVTNIFLIWIINLALINMKWYFLNKNLSFCCIIWLKRMIIKEETL